MQAQADQEDQLNLEHQLNLEDLADQMNQADQENQAERVDESREGEDPKGESHEAENTETRRTKTLNRYVALTMEKRALQAREKIINEELEKLEEVVKDIFIESGWTSVATTQGTVYIHRDVVARLRKDADGGFDQAHQALENCGLGYMVKGNVNTSSLGAYVREREKYEEEIPPEAAQWIIKTELFRARVRAPA